MADGPLFWHQGVFLQPQHFQQADARMEDLLADALNLTGPWRCGIRAVQLDSGALAAGTCSLLAAQALFPGSGVLIDIPRNAFCAARVLPVDLPIGGRLPVHLALPVLRPALPNVTLCDDAASLSATSTRLAVLTGQAPVADLYAEGPAAHVRRLTYVTRLVFGDEAAQETDVLLLPLLCLLRTSAGYTVDEDFAPPALSLDDAPVLLRLFREVRDRVIGKTRQLDTYKNLSQRGSMGDLAALFMVLRSLARFSVRIDMVSEAPRVAPSDAYCLLRELVAELSVFSRECNPLGENYNGEPLVLPYVHNDPAPAFRSVRDLLVRLLDGLATGPRYLLRFESRPPFLEVRLAPHVLDNPKNRNEFWVVLASEQTVLAQLRSSGLLMKFAAAGDLPTFLARAVPGVPFSLEDTPPIGMARRPGALYVRLHHDSPLWAEVERQGGLALAWEEAPGDLEAQFVVLEGA